MKESHTKHSKNLLKQKEVKEKEQRKQPLKEKVLLNLLLTKMIY